jgi:hypothetical protein
MLEIVNIAQEANRRSMIENRRWDGALILGPAVLAPLKDVQISNSSFDALPESLFLQVDEDRHLVGVVGVQNVVFNDCEFRNVGIVGTPASIAQFQQAFALAEGGTITAQGPHQGASLGGEGSSGGGPPATDS